MSNRVSFLNAFYGMIDEDSRLLCSRQGQLEYAVTMHYIHRFAGAPCRVLELGAGTGRYSAALAREGMDVTALELADANFAVLREKAREIPNLRAVQGDATDLHAFADASFDVTLSFGPLYHLYEPDEVQRAIDEAIRVTRPGGYLFCAFLSVYGIMLSNYLCGGWQRGVRENFAEDGRVLHFEEQRFTGYDIAEFEGLFAGKGVRHIVTAGVDWSLEVAEPRADFALSDADFESLVRWYLTVCEKRELLGNTNHLLYIAQKTK